MGSAGCGSAAPAPCRPPRANRSPRSTPATSRLRTSRTTNLTPARQTPPERLDLPARPTHPSPSRPQERTTQLRETDYIALLDAAHQQLGGPIVLVWDNLNSHISAAMRQMINGRDWLHVIRLPAYAPDLNPTEQVWSHLKHSIGNFAVRGVDHLQAIIKNRLKRIQYRADLLDNFLAHTGLTLAPDST
ncbi:transposase [Micromonospora aurantiaca (nom. illeg.)]|uniref:transposase n=1 Tax=Micromonospora aurantiaca (nom. illeg.) TaxID=47850 RepID=UPI0034021BBC